MLQANDFEQAITRLRSAGLAPTFERLAVTKLLLDGGPGVTLDDLIDRAREQDLPLGEWPASSSTCATSPSNPAAFFC